MADVFLSYAREDRETAERLAHVIEKHGWSVWWDRHVPAGKRFDEVIAESLASARCVVVLWSDAAIASDWVGEEAEEARERGLMVPALIEAVEPPLGFRRIQAADLVAWKGDDGHPGLQRLLVDIRNLLGATPAVARRGRRGRFRHAVPPLHALRPRRGGDRVRSRRRRRRPLALRRRPADAAAAGSIRGRLDRRTLARQR